MGRGRAKAKQTKVARELKYFSPQTDYDALQRELHGPDRFRTTARDDSAASESEEELDDDPSSWSRYAAEDDYDEWASKRRA
jgi:hypothetical protein